MVWSECGHAVKSMAVLQMSTCTRGLVSALLSLPLSPLPMWLSFNCIRIVSLPVKLVLRRVTLRSVTWSAFSYMKLRFVSQREAS